MPDIQIVIPPTSDEPLTDMLVVLTEAINASDPELVAHGALGGRFGYGGCWNSEVFQMHPFCWCGSDNCPWCFYNVSWDEPQLACAEEYGADNQNGGGIAPHFWHKPSGMKVWWYKWIGRDMESVNVPSDLSAIFTECLADVQRASANAQQSPGRN